jgi:sugar phosphate isomerase/epimerase
MLSSVSGLAGKLSAQPLGMPIGSQTYPHRQRIVDGDFAGLCKDMAALGVGSLELCCPNYKEFASLHDGKQTKKILDDHGLICQSAHFTLGSLRTRQSEMIDWAHDIGMTQMSTASLGNAETVQSAKAHDGMNTMDIVKSAADDYNKIGERAAKAGLQQVLHDEGFELAKVEGDGRLTYTVLLELLDPKLVKMQFQMIAMRVVGDPVMYFQKYPGRFISMHCQGVDLKGDPGMGLDGAAIGHDSLDWPKIFAAAKAGGLKNYFVEQNWDMTVKSVEYIKTLKV